MPAATRATWGIAGLLGFEVILLAYTFILGAYAFTATALVAALALGEALRRARRGAPAPALLLGVLAAATLARALLQATGGSFPPGVAPTFLVPAGFALLAWGGSSHAASRAGIVMVALARTWFIGWYALGGNGALVLANLVGAAGAWAWATQPRAEAGDADAAPA